MSAVNPDAPTLTALIQEAIFAQEPPLDPRVRDLLVWCRLELDRLHERVGVLETGLAGEIDRLERILDGETDEEADR